MTQRKRTPHKGQKAAKQSEAPARPSESERPTIEVDVEFPLDEPLLSLPPPPRDRQATITDEAELERARLRSLQMSSFPPQRTSVPPMEPILGLANASAPSTPPHAPDEDVGNPTAPPPPDALKAMEREERGADPIVDMRDRHSLGDYTGALQIAEQILQEHPENAEAIACAESCRDVLLKMYSARIGPLDKVPMVMVARNQLRWLSLDHRAGFVLSHIDGVSSIEMILDVSGMPPLDCLRILYELVQQRVISFR